MAIKEICFHLIKRQMKPVAYLMQTLVVWLVGHSKVVSILMNMNQTAKYGINPMAILA